jgi:YgiT-type zinc finger domain-containing protein
LKPETNGEHQASPECERCGRETHEAVVMAAFWSDRGLTVVEDVPARVCEACGEQSFGEEAARRIERVLASPPADATRELRVPVFSLASMETTIEYPDIPRDLRCQHCESPTDENVIRSALWTASGLIAVEDVPARVCRECNEPYYDAETVGKIIELTGEGYPAHRAQRELAVPVFSLMKTEVD